MTHIRLVKEGRLREATVAAWRCDSFLQRRSTSDWGDIYKIIGFRVCDVSIIIRVPPLPLAREKRMKWGEGGNELQK